MNYKKAVADNLEYMQTTSEQWKAVPISYIDENEGLPVFDFPEHFNHGKSLYKSESDTCCEWCGKKIKRVYWIMNPSEKLLLMTGSECITHFQDESGEQMTKKAQHESRRELLRQCVKARLELSKRFSFRGHLGYGRYTQTWRNHQARELWEQLKDCVGKLFADDMSYFEKASSNSAITRWYNKNHNTANRLLNEYMEIVK